MRLYLARHGESTGNAQRLIFGQRDYPLTDKGRAQARALGQSLEGAHIERVISSARWRRRVSPAQAPRSRPTRG